MMDVFEAIQKRKSVRVYDSVPIPKEKLEKLFEAARLAPSADNLQPWHFIIVTDPEKRKQLSKAPFASFLAESPVVLVACGDKKASPNWYMVDVAIALEHIVLTATNEGLGTCWVGSFNEPRVKEMLRIPEQFKVVALLAIGYSCEKIDLRRTMVKIVRMRKKLEGIVSIDEYGNSLRPSQR
jgi:nitroreductase